MFVNRFLCITYYSILTTVGMYVLFMTSLKLGSDPLILGVSNLSPEPKLDL